MSCEPDRNIVRHGHHVVHIVHIFSASPEKLFDAWIEPHIMRRWMFAHSGDEIHWVGNQRCVGGLFYSIRAREDGGEIDHFGEYCAIDRPNYLVFSLNMPGQIPRVSCISVGIRPSPNGSVMTFIQTGVRKEIAEALWRKKFDMLTHVLKPPF
jgi:uncharacterized protein YndB with AHSA1/START domain